jgi:Tfp pilus assembly protein PilN
VDARLNLASEPFRNRTLPWAVAVTLACASLIALFFIISETNQTTVQADIVERQYKDLSQQEQTLKAHANEVTQALTPEQLRALQDAHALIDRKRFSWSRLFADLEAALPANVRVTRINVRDVALRAGQTFAELDLAVVGKNTDDVTRMIAEMDRTGVFQAEPLTQTPVKDKNQTGTEWTLHVYYKPRGDAPSADEDPNASAATAVAPANTSQARNDTSLRR